MLVFKSNQPVKVVESRDLKDRQGGVFKRVVKVAFMGGQMDVVWPDGTPFPADGSMIEVGGEVQAGYKPGLLDFDVQFCSHNGTVLIGSKGPSTKAA